VLLVSFTAEDRIAGPPDTWVCSDNVIGVPESTLRAATDGCDCVREVMNSEEDAEGFVREARPDDCEEDSSCAELEEKSASQSHSLEELSASITSTTS
jgi:hypothetical protein